MKKILSLILVLSMLFVITACTQISEKNKVDNTTTIHTETFSEIDDNIKETITANDVGGGYIESGKYRQCYYDVPYDFVVLVGEDEFDRWYDEIYDFNPDKSQMVSFVQYFNISKEVFEKTNLQMTKSFAEFNPTLRPMDYENQQTYEVYNADIIYTFNDEIINEYYLIPDYPYCADFEYEAAVRRGEYTSQTEEWIDVEQMEAEIIAKYGEAEIVTENQTPETETVIQEETTAIDSPKSETTE